MANKKISEIIVKDSLTLNGLVKLGDNGEILEYWTLIFSPKLKQFRYEKLWFVLKENAEQLIRTDGECAGFNIVGIAKELEDLSPIYKKIKGSLKTETSWFI